MTYSDGYPTGTRGEMLQKRDTWVSVSCGSAGREEAKWTLGDDHWCHEAVGPLGKALGTIGKADNGSFGGRDLKT